MLEKHIIIGNSVDLSRGRGKFSILADCMEACLGAIYLDSGLKPCKKIIINFISNEQMDLLLDERVIRNYKTFCRK